MEFLSIVAPYSVYMCLSEHGWLCFVYMVELTFGTYLSAELSGSMKRIRGGAERVSVANIPPCSWTPNPFRGSPLRVTSLDSVWTIWPPGPTELEAKDTAKQRETSPQKLAFIHSGAVHSQCGFMFKNVRRRPMEWETWCVFLEHTSCEMLQKTADVRATVRYILCERPIKVKLHSKTYKPFKNSSQISHLWDIMKCIKTVF